MLDLCGWKNNPPEVDRIAATFAMPFFGAPSPDRTKEVFLYRVHKEVSQLDIGTDVQKIGDCVSFGHKHFVEILNAVEIKLGASFEYQPISSEVIYALSRVEVGGQRGDYQDGSVGAWAMKALNIYGCLSRPHLKALGLSPEYDPRRAKEWGAQGLPDNLEPYAKDHTVIETASLVTNFNDAAWHIQNGRPVTVCSDVGFENGGGGQTHRDNDGYAQPRGSWPHCMCFIGVRWAPRPALLLLNQWPPQSLSGNKYPEDQPDNSWWVEANVCDRMLAQKDSWTGDKYKGYPTRDLDWRF